VEEFLALAAAPGRDRCTGRTCRPAARCSVRPVEHSLSPVIHQGSAVDCGNAPLHLRPRRRRGACRDPPAAVSGRPPECRGFSVTMPGKSAAHDLADEITDRAAVIGSANTLSRYGTPRGAESERGVPTTPTSTASRPAFRAVLGRDRARWRDGASSWATVAPPDRPSPPLAAAGCGTSVTVLARSERALNLQSLVESYGMDLPTGSGWTMNRTAASVCAAATPRLHGPGSRGRESGLASTLAQAAAVVDVIYDPYPTDLDDSRRGGRTPGRRRPADARRAGCRAVPVVHRGGRRRLDEMYRSAALAPTHPGVILH
jgi:shikimate dehydrogenase